MELYDLCPYLFRGRNLRKVRLSITELSLCVKATRNFPAYEEGASYRVTINPAGTRTEITFYTYFSHQFEALSNSLTDLAVSGYYVNVTKEEEE